MVIAYLLLLNHTPVWWHHQLLISVPATILAGIEIGKNAIIGAGSVVTKDVKSDTTVVGVPARVIKRKKR